MTGETSIDDVIPDPRTRNHRTMAFWMRTWVRNAVANAHRFAAAPRVDSLWALKGKHSGKPAIVIGAGPSLDDLLDNGGIDTLRCLQRAGGVVLCPNSVFRAVVARGIDPDYCCVLHPTPEIAMGFAEDPTAKEPRGCDIRNRKLIAPVTVHPQVFDLWADRGLDGAIGDDAGAAFVSLQGYQEQIQILDKLEGNEARVVNVSTADLPGDWYGVCQPSIFNEYRLDDPSFPVMPWHEKGLRLPSIPNMGCVINYEVMVASVLGCSPIALIGVDFCFTPDATGVARFRCDDWRKPEGKEWQRVSRNQAEDQVKIYGAGIKGATGIDGQEHICHEAHIAYRNSMHGLYRAFVSPDKKPLDIVNCSGAGIVTKVPRMPFKRFADITMGGHWRPRKDRT